MSDDKNYWNVSGTLLKDCNVPSVTKNGNKMLFFIINSKKGNFSTYVDCIAWGENAELIARNGKAGTHIEVIGNATKMKNLKTNGYDVKLNVTKVNEIDTQEDQADSDFADYVSDDDVPF